MTGREPDPDAAYLFPVSFATERLEVRGWNAHLSTPDGRRSLEAALAEMLTPAVLAPLPDSLALAPGKIAAWIDARDAESAVHTVARRVDGRIVGLLILAGGDWHGAHRSVHLGYLFAEASWGQGLASELVAGLAAALQNGPEVHLLAGVADGNAASVRVLEKAGFVSERGGDGATVFVRITGGGTA